MQNNKLIVLSILGVALVVFGALFLTRSTTTPRVLEDDSKGDVRAEAQVGRAVLENGVQYVDIMVRGGYSPRVTKAQAGVPTVLRMKTENTYDCSSALVINDLGYQSYLPATGVTEIQVPAEKAQGTLRGMCSMAMYHFQVDFE
jgi:plastocyanin domain-containing protein